MSKYTKIKFSQTDNGK